MWQQSWGQHFLRYVWLIFCAVLLSCVTECTKLSVSQGQTLVYPRLVESRSSKGMKVVQITEHLTLNLEKSSVVGKEFLLRTYQKGFMQHTYLDGEILEEDLYHDSESLASVMVSDDNGLRVEGILGLTLRIKPLDEQERTTEGNIPHVLYECKNDDTMLDVEGVMRIKSRASVSERQYAHQGQSLPAAIYPELLILVDSTLRAQFSADAKVLKYFIMTVNAANLRYTTVSPPKVKLIIQALEILTTKEEVFLQRVGSDRVKGYDTLETLRVHVSRNRVKYGLYDIVYLATGLDMGWQSSKGWENGLRGIAYIGGACTAEKVGYGEDYVGSFLGVRILAHEVGHLLGCPHDGQGTGYFDSRSCPWNDSYIMSYLDTDSRSMKFSNCCNNMITRKVGFPSGKCLLSETAKRKIKKVDYTLLLPGDMYDRDRICRMAFPDVKGTHFMTEGGTAKCHARCYMPDPLNKTVLRVLLPDHSPCNEAAGKVCINGDCVRRKKKPRYYRPHL